MNAEAYQQLIDVINEKCLWLKAEAHKHKIMMTSVEWGKVVNCMTYVIPLQVIKKHPPFMFGKHIYVSETNIDMAIRKMSADAKFIRRYDNARLTDDDIERIICEATAGIVKLDLIKD